MLTVKFQRHLLGADEQLNPSLVSHPRFDFGAYPWSHFYGPKLVPDRLPLTEAHKLVGLVRAASAVSKLVSSPAVNEALRALEPSLYCELTLLVAVLQSQGVAIRVLHHMLGGTWPDAEVLAQPGRFRAGRPAAASIPLARR